MPHNHCQQSNYQLLRINVLKSGDKEGNWPSPACPEPSGVTHIHGVTLWANHVTGDLSPTFGRGGGVATLCHPANKDNVNTPKYPLTTESD